MFITFDALRAQEPKVDWILPGFLSRSHITMLAGKPKAGKSTFLFHLIRALDAGTPFLGMHPQPTKIGLVSEEADEDLVERADEMHITGKNLFTRVYALGSTWNSVLSDIRTAINTIGLELVVLDTLSRWWDIDNENESAATQKALNQLLDLVRTSKLSVLINHHSTKEGDPYRGSTAILGAVDYALAFRKDKMHEFRRVITSDSRSRKTPKSLTIELASDFSAYNIVGEHNVVVISKSQTKQAILEYINNGNKVTITELLTNLTPQPKERLLRYTIGELVASGTLCQEGDGTRNSPYCYAKA